jgi:trafficking kinesin-binding protein 1
LTTIYYIFFGCRNLEIQFTKTILSSITDFGIISDTPTATRSISVDLLQRKVASLEVMNTQLKAEATYIATETAVVEEKEKQLIEDISAQLGSAKKERSNLTEELYRYKEENKSQYQEIRSLASKLAKFEDMNAELSTDNNFLTQLVSTTKQTQDLLCAEILDLKEQYAQVRPQIKFTC